VKKYRIYKIEASNRVSGPPEIVDCPDDAEAVETANQRVDGHAVEVWESARLVARLEAEQQERNFRK
jgi:hypothetical protein